MSVKRFFIFAIIWTMIVATLEFISSFEENFGGGITDDDDYF